MKSLLNVLILLVVCSSAMAAADTYSDCAAYSARTIRLNYRLDLDDVRKKPDIDLSEAIRSSLVAAGLRVVDREDEEYDAELRIHQHVASWSASYSGRSYRTGAFATYYFLLRDRRSNAVLFLGNVAKDIKPADSISVDESGRALDISTPYMEAAFGDMALVSNLAGIMKCLAPERNLDFLVALKAAFPPVESGVLEELGNLDDERAVDALVGDVDSQFAIRSLAKLHSNKAVSPLIKELVSLSGMWSSCSNYTRVQFELVFDALEKSDPNWRVSQAATHAIPALAARRNDTCEAAMALAELGDKRAIAPLMVKLKKDFSSYTKYRQDKEDIATFQRDISYLAQLDAKIALGTFIDILTKSRDDSVMDTVLNALERLDPNWRDSPEAKRAVNTLFAKLKTDETVAFWLANFKDERAIAPLIDQMATRGNVLTALNKISPDWRTNAAARDAVPRLIAKLRDTSTDRRRLSEELWGVAYTLGNLDDKSVDPVLIDVLNESFIVHQLTSSWVPEEIVKILGDRGDKSAVPALILMVKRISESADQSEESIKSLKCEIAKSLAKIGDTSAIPSLVDLSLDDDLKVHDAAYKALDEVDPNWRKSEVVKGYVPKLIDAIKYSGIKYRTKVISYNRSYATKMLGEIGDTTVVAPLVINLLDEKGFFRVETAIALGKIGDTSAVNPLIRKLGEESSWEANKVIQALDALQPNWCSTQFAKEFIPKIIPQLKHRLASPNVEIGRLSDEYDTAKVLAALGEAPTVRSFFEEKMRKNDADSLSAAREFSIVLGNKVACNKINESKGATISHSASSE